MPAKPMSASAQKALKSSNRGHCKDEIIIPNGLKRRPNTNVGQSMRLYEEYRPAVHSAPCRCYCTKPDNRRPKKRPEKAWGLSEWHVKKAAVSPLKIKRTIPLREMQQTK